MRLKAKKRRADEVLELGRAALDVGVRCSNPVFDVDPGDLIDAIVTEKGVIERPERASWPDCMSFHAS